VLFLGLAQIERPSDVPNDEIGDLAELYPGASCQQPKKPNMLDGTSAPIPRLPAVYYQSVLEVEIFPCTAERWFMPQLFLTETESSRGAGRRAARHAQRVTKAV
jgi:hypothetical protein